MNRHVLCLVLGILPLVNCSRPPIEVPTGTFYGTLPCADCPGIRYELTLNGDGTYVESTEYLEKSVAPQVDSGTYEVQQDTVVRLLKPSGEGMNRWAVADGNLRMLDQSGAPIESDFTRQYILSPEKPSESSAKTHREVDFKATGNEPFWSLEIDFDQRMRFKDLNGIELVTPVPTATYPQENVTEWQASTEQGDLLVTVTREDCQDTMSGDTSGYQVQVHVTIGDAAAYSYSGCGRYLGRFRLNNRWVLTSLNEQTIDAENEAPYVEFQLTEKRAIGFGGCNRFSGSFELTDATLELGTLASTKMACPTLDNEAAFLQALSQQKLSFRMEERRLRLSNDSTTLVFCAAN